MEMNVVIYNIPINFVQALRIITIAFELFVSIALMKGSHESLVDFWMAFFKALIYRVKNINSTLFNGVVT